MNKRRIVIVGGGIAGLSAAHFLCDYPDFEIILYESQDDVGGQARSMFGKYCYIEYSWRIFGQVYHNINKIINEIGADNNFTALKNPCIVNSLQNAYYGKLSYTNLFKILLKDIDYTLLNKILNIATICKDRAINAYDDINAYEYFNKNPIIQSIMGPFLGMDANKLSLSGYYKNIISTSDSSKFYFTPTDTRISKHPTQESLFVPWVKYLKSKGVKIYTNSKLFDINIINNSINSITIKHNNILQNIRADEYIFTCSLKSINTILQKNAYFHNKNITYSLKQLEKGLQLYYTINLYFSIQLENKTNLKCDEFVLTDTPWKLIVQRKHLWNSDYLNKCKKTDKQIKDVFNVGFLDYNTGVIYNKILSECSKEEAIHEGIEQFKRSNFVKDIFNQYNTTFEDVFVGYEDWFEFRNDKNNNLISDNPKFSTNVGLLTYMPKTAQPNDLPKNMFLGGYYVSSTMGGVSMEASCETGLCAGLSVIKKYNKKIISYPIYHKNEYITPYTKGLCYLDKYLFKYNIQNISEFIPSSILICIYFISIIIIIIIVMKFTYNIFAK
jgi:uncharacterized protein with NAD-binding domain and iron-sulfur cluster